jgi:hypothetical protein
MRVQSNGQSILRKLTEKTVDTSVPLSIPELFLTQSMGLCKLFVVYPDSWIILGGFNVKHPAIFVCDAPNHFWTHTRMRHDSFEIKQFVERVSIG